MKKTFLTVAIFLILFSGLSAQVENTSYRNALKEMMVASGSDQTYSIAIKQMLNVFRMQKSDVPAEAWDTLEKEFLNTSFDDLLDMLVPVYEKQLSVEDLNGLTAFYNTPLGKKYASKLPAITTESMQVGQQWGMQIGKKVQEILKEKGY